MKKIKQLLAATWNVIDVVGIVVTGMLALVMLALGARDVWERAWTTGDWTALNIVAYYLLIKLVIWMTRLKRWVKNLHRMQADKPHNLN